MSYMADCLPGFPFKEDKTEVEPLGALKEKGVKNESFEDSDRWTPAALNSRMIMDDDE
jgi:hypothetical protein